MRVLLPEIHLTLTISLCRAFQDLGVDVLLVGPGFKAPDNPGPRMDHGVFSGPMSLFEDGGVHNVTVVGPEILEEPIDLLLIPAHHVQRQMLRGVWPRMARHPGARLAFFCGNEMPHYRFDLAKNVLCADAFTESSMRSRIPNFQTYFPWIDYDRFSYGGPSDQPLLGTYINLFQSRYPREFALSQEIVTSVPGLKLEVADNLNPDQVAALMRASMATLHIKPQEGYGYSVIESLASGRPVVLPRKFVQGRTMARWLEEGRSSLCFDDAAEAEGKLIRLLTDSGYRHALQRASAELIRQRIDNAEQTRALKTFLENLLPQPAPSLWTRCLDLRHRHWPETFAH